MFNRVSVVMQNLESHGIQMTDFQALRSKEFFFNVLSHGKWTSAIQNDILGQHKM